MRTACTPLVMMLLVAAGLAPPARAGDDLPQFGKTMFLSLKEPGAVDDEIAAHTKAIEKNRKDAAAYLGRGVAHLRKKEYFALDLVTGKKVATVSISKGKTTVTFADKLSDREVEADEALADLTEALRLDPKSGSALYHRGSRYLQVQRYASAIADLQDALVVDPKHADAPARLATAVDKLRGSRAKPAIEVLAVTLDEELTSVVVKRSPPYKLAANTEKVVEDTVRVMHEVTVTDGWKAEAEVRGAVRAWFAEVQAGVRAGIEKTTSRKYGVESERKRSVTLRGGSDAGVCVVWVDLYRTGKVRLKVDGTTVELPIRFRDDFDLLTEAAVK